MRELYNKYFYIIICIWEPNPSFSPTPQSYTSQASSPSWLINNIHSIHSMCHMHIICQPMSRQHIPNILPKQSDHLCIPNSQNTLHLSKLISHCSIGSRNIRDSLNSAHPRKHESIQKKWRMWIPGRQDWRLEWSIWRRCAPVSSKSMPRPWKPSGTFVTNSSTESPPMTKFQWRRSKI